MTEPLPGKLVKSRTPEGPYEVGPPTLSGTLTFPCCSENWVVTHDRITHVRCPDCGNLYTLALKFSVNPSTPQSLPKGTLMEVTSAFTLKVGAREYTTKVGERLRVGMDAYGLFFVPEGGIILEFESLGMNGPRTLLAVAPLNHLKIIEETHVKSHHAGNDQNSRKTS